jgi:hypothetical protein
MVHKVWSPVERSSPRASLAWRATARVRFAEMGEPEKPADSFLEQNEDELKVLAGALTESKGGDVAVAAAALLVKVVTGSSIAAGAAEKAAAKVFGQWLADNRMRA